MRPYIRWSLGLFLLLRASAAHSQQQSLSDQHSRELSASDSALIAVHKFGSRFGETRSTIRRALGPPRYRSAEVSESHYSAGPDSIIKWTYSGRRFSIVRVAFDAREFLLKTEITNRREPLPAGLKIGRSKKREIIAALGPPDTEKTVADTVILSFTPPWQFYEDVIDLYLIRGTLQKIRWWFYID